MYEVILPNGDRAEAETGDAIVLAATQLIREAAAAGASSSWLSEGLIFTKDGRHIYDPVPR